MEFFLNIQPAYIPPSKTQTELTELRKIPYRLVQLCGGGILREGAGRGVQARAVCETFHHHQLGDKSEIGIRNIKQSLI